MENILFIVLLFVLFSSLRSRQKKRTRMSRQPSAEEMKNRSKEKSRPGSDIDSGDRTVSAAGSGYDYGRFREKLRTAWNLPGQNGSGASGEEEKELTLPQDLDGPLYQEKDPAPVFSQAMMQAQPIQPARGGTFTVRQEERKEGAQTASGIWTERDVERWAVYDAVLGEPRSRRPWNPAGRNHS